MEGPIGGTEFLIIFIIAAVIIWGMVSRASGSATVENSPKASKVPTTLAPLAAFKLIIGFAQGNGYSVASIDETTLSLRLEEKSQVGVGFFFPINVVPSTEGGAVVEIGTGSKLQLPGSAVAPTHDKFVAGVRAALFAAQ